MSETAININKQTYVCTLDEYPSKHHSEYNNLKILDNLGKIEREMGLVKDISEYLENPTLLYSGIPHSSFVGVNCSSHFKNIFIHVDKKSNEEDRNRIHENIKNHKNIFFSDSSSTTSIELPLNNTIIKVYDELSDELLSAITDIKPIVLSRQSTKLDSLYSLSYTLSSSDQVLYIPDCFEGDFYKGFHYYIKNDGERILYYDNLIHLCIMVKNGGEVFERVLTENLQWIDRWTILDTGSTDNTIEIINKVLVGKKKGKLYQEPFINFRESRNRCLDLCGTVCKYNVMLDDTYIIQGDFRDFLEIIRGDQFADSYSLVVKSDDTEYYSNRVTKSENKLRYIYTIHEVIQKDNNVNVIIPSSKAWIFDVRLEYMEKRTMARKQYDLECLFDMVREYPDDPRHLYYIAQTYTLLEKHELAAEFFYKRAFNANEGFDQERNDALFEATRITNFKLNGSWEDCERGYNLLHEWDPERPEASYFLGIHCYMEGDMKRAYDYFQRGFHIGYPIHRQYSLKPTLSYHFLPKFLSKLCYQFDNPKLGHEVTSLFLKHNKPEDDEYENVLSLHNIFNMINNMAVVSHVPRKPGVPIFCFVADGGFKKWSGSSIIKEGVGGSETYIIEMARYIKKHSSYEVAVFCNCENAEIFEDVKYLPLIEFLTYAAELEIEHCVISRFAEYIPVAIKGHVKNIHLVVHDLVMSGNIIPVHPKIKNVFCLTEWHKRYFLERFSEFRDITHGFHYGIDFKYFQNRGEMKIKNSFIYSSFPNRGLLVVLKMWRLIRQRYSDATLNIFCDMNNNWSNQNFPEEMQTIRDLLEELKDSGVTNHGWVSKEMLGQYWRSSHVWFYPCKFKETFCLTALEAALSKTLPITNNLASLEDTVGDRGISIEGDVMTEDWQNRALEIICEHLDDTTKMNDYIDRNFTWALEHSWEQRAIKLLEHITQDANDNIEVHGGENVADGEVNKNENHESELEKSLLSLIVDLDFSQLPAESDVIKNLHWSPIEEVRELNYELCKNMTNVLEIGPGTIPFKYATHYVDNKQSNNKVNSIIMNIDVDKYEYEEKFFDYAYCRHVFEDIQNPDHAFSELKYISKNGYVETPSPLIELCRNVDAVSDLGHNNYRGYRHHRYIVFTDYETNTLCFVPKLPLIEYLTFDDEFQKRMYTLANTHPIYWNNYYVWNSSKKANFKVYSPDLIDMKTYSALLNKAIISSFENTNKFFKNIFNEINSFTSSRQNFYHVERPLDYADMYNWTNDLPHGSKPIFEKVLDKFKHKIRSTLEIGTFAGTSIINILRRLPYSRGTTIDRWKSYDEKYGETNIESLSNIETNNIENIYDNNIKISGMEGRVDKMKGDSVDMLINLIKQNKKFDFIYVDGSHRCNDTFTDCVLSWHLLSSEGVMAIDDYLYKTQNSTDVLDIPYHGVNEFLEKYKGRYKTIDVGYRIFIQKIS